MKTLLICSSDTIAIPTALKLKEQGLLQAIAIPEKFKTRLLPSFLQVGFSADTILTVTKENLSEKLNSIIINNEIDTVFVLTFPWKIPNEILSIPENGCINLHPGLLPKYRGADPVFWQIKNREINGGITAHLMTDKIDNGPILLIDQLPIMPGEPYGMHCQRIGAFAAQMILKVVALLQTKTTIKYLDIENVPDLYFKRPDKNNIRIDWNHQSAIEIESLVNACNPKYSGAITTIRAMELAIVEVSPADVNNVASDVLPGTIIYADGLYGIIVKCSDGQFLKINIVCMGEGYISGPKLFNLGFRVGETFV
jgi:methionyl-tRNA formyltransferase